MEKSESESSSEVATSKPWQSYHTVYTTAKAGMDGVDKEKVQRIVYEMSKGSKYFENEERKEAFIRQKIEHMRARCAKLSAAELAHFQKVADRRVVELEAKRDLSRFWLHVDMDAFYAAVETLSNPSLKGKPMAVGSLSMISTANYEARKYGVRAAMPGFIARKLCPELIFVPVDFEKYNHYSSLTREVFRRYDPNFIAASLDEAYLDITEVCRERGLSSDEVAEELRRGVFEETELTCSAGVAPNRLLAKVCSDINKPNGQFVLPNDRIAVMTFISSLPIRKIGGIGKVTEHILRDVFGISTCEEMLQKGGFLCALFSRSSADFFLSVALGLGRTDAPEARLRKSMSNERTFPATENEAFLYGKLVELAEMLATDLQKEGLRGRTLTLKLKTASFEVRTRAVTLQRYISSSEDILCHARKLLKAELPLSVRLIGLRVSQFSEEKGASSDPAQKSITNFIVFGNASGSGNNICGTDNLGLREEASSSADNHGDDVDSELHTDYVHKDEFDSDQLSDLSLSIYSKSEITTYMDHCPHNNMQPDGILKSNESDIQQLVERQEPSEATRNSDTQCDGEPSSLQDELQWIDGYKCCICGIELPPDFVHERQEHSDFHLAERMQKECSDQPVTNQWVKQRPLGDKRQTVGQSSHKKRKSTAEQRKFLSIDKFFIKENKNI